MSSFQIEGIYPMNQPERLTQDLRVAAPKLEQLSPATEREAIDLLATLLVDVATRNAAGYGKNSRSDVPRSGSTRPIQSAGE
jgi:hypothetical protein